MSDRELVYEVRLLRRTIANAALFVGLSQPRTGERSDVELRALGRSMNALAETAWITPEEIAIPS